MKLEGTCHALLAYDIGAAVEQEVADPGPEVRDSAVCKHSGMRARICGYCWTKLSAPAERDGAE